MNQKLLKTKLKESWALARRSSPCPASLGSDWLLPSSVGEMAMQVFTPQVQRNMKQVMKTLLVLLGVLFGFAEPVFAQAKPSAKPRYITTVRAGGEVELENINNVENDNVFSSIQVINGQKKDGILFWIRSKKKITSVDFNDRTEQAVFENGRIGIKASTDYNIGVTIDGEKLLYQFFANCKAELLYGKQADVTIGKGEANPSEISIESDEDLKKVVGVPSGVFKTSWWHFSVEGKNEVRDQFEDHYTVSLRDLLTKAKELFPNHQGEFLIRAQFSDGIDNYDPKTDESFGYSICSVKIVDNRPVLPPPAPKYNVTLTQGVGGLIAIVGKTAQELQAIEEGTTLTVVATPAEGYELVRLMAGNEDITQSGRFVVRANTEVRAEWRKRTYSVTYTPSTGGTLRITGAANLAAVAHGTELRIEATPAEAYELMRITAGNEDITQSGRFVVRSNTEVRAEWRKRTYSIELPSVPHVRLSIKGKPDLSAVEYGTQLELEVTPDEGYVVDVVRIDGNALTAPYRFTVTGTPSIEVRIRQKVGIEIVETVTLRLYPNPASTYIVVEGAAVGQWVRIYSLGGVLLQESQITEGKQRIALASLERGVYLVRIGIQTFHLVVE